MVGTINCCRQQNLSKTKTQNEKIDRKANDRRRQERPRKLEERDLREMSDNHVLRIPDQCGHAADVCTGRERDEVRQGGSLPRLITATTSGVSIKQIVSLTKTAERIPEVSVT